MVERAGPRRPLIGWPPANAASLICTVYLLDPTHGRSWCRRGLGQPRVDQLAHQHDALVDQLVLALATTGELEAARRAAARLPEEAVGRRLVRFLLGEWEEAAAQWQAALDHDLAAGDRHDAVVNARWLADALLVLGEERRAAEVLRQALEIAAAAPQVPSEIWLRARLAGLASTEPDEAAAHLARCEQVLATGDDWRGLVGEVALARAAVALRAADYLQQGWPRSTRSRLSMTTGCRGAGGGTAHVGTRTLQLTAGRTRAVPDATSRRRARPDRGPAAVVDRRAGGSSGAVPDLNTTSTRQHHTRAMTDSDALDGSASNESVPTFDAVVVGARCAGSSLAVRLARGGWRVAVVDRARFPSDTVSTHVIFPDGVARLDDLGVLSASTSPRPDARPLLLAGAGPRGRRMLHAGRRT